jgi:hypothetical protein
MDLVGPTHVRSVGGKWYVLDVVDDYSWYAWMFFLEEKGETFGFVRSCLEVEEREAWRCHMSDSQ